MISLISLMTETSWSRETRSTHSLPGARVNGGTKTTTGLPTVHAKEDMIHDVRFEGAEVCVKTKSESAEGKSRANLRVLPPFIVDEVLEDALLIGGVLRPHL